MTNQYTAMNDKSTISTWVGLCAYYPKGERLPASAEKLAKDLKIARTASQKHTKLFRALGLIKSEEEWGQRSRFIFYTRLVDEAEGERLIHKHFDEGGTMVVKGLTDLPSSSVSRAKTKKAPRITNAEDLNRVFPKVAVDESETRSTKDVLRASAGPEPEPTMRLVTRPAMKDEEAALVEAARQYSTRHEAVFAKFSELEAMGITIDREKAMKAVKLERDDELEGVSKVLPYIDRLERNLDRALANSNTVRDDAKELRAELAKVQNDLKNERAANHRLAEKLTKVRINSNESRQLEA